MNLGSPSPHLAVVILNWNHTDDTLACVQQLQAWQCPPKIWVVDNASDGDAAERLQQALPKSHLSHLIFNKKNLGFGGGNNSALAEIVAEWCATQHPEYILLLNNDAGLTESTTRQLLDTLQAQPNIAMLGTAIANTEQPSAHAEQVSFGGKDIVRWIDTRHPALPNPASPEIADVFYVPATAAILRTQALAEVGLLDPDYFFSIEIADWCYRARAKGWRSCIHLGTRITHNVGRSGAMRNTLHAYYSVRNRFLFLHKQNYPNKNFWQAMWLWRGCYAAMTSVLFGQWLRARALLAAVGDGLAGKTGMAPHWLQPK